MSTEMSPCVILISVFSCVSARHYSSDLKPKLVSISVTLDMICYEICTMSILQFCVVLFRPCRGHYFHCGAVDPIPYCSIYIPS